MKLVVAGFRSDIRQGLNRDDINGTGNRLPDRRIAPVGMVVVVDLSMICIRIMVGRIVLDGPEGKGADIHRRRVGGQDLKG